MNTIQKQSTEKKWYNKIWLINNLAWLYLALTSAYLDVKNFLKFRKEIRELRRDPHSKFNQLGLKVNWLGNIVYTQKIMDRDRVIGLDDRRKNLYLIENTTIEHQYLFDELVWGEYLITNFIDFSDDKGNISGYYGITFTFTPMTVNNPRLYWILLFYLAFFGIIIWISRSWILAGLKWIIGLF
jgi:hypothetical protein